MRLALDVLREPVDLNRDHKRIGVRFHADEALVATGAEANKTLREVAEIVVFLNLLSFVFVVQVRDEPVLRVLENVRANRADLLRRINQPKV